MRALLMFFVLSFFLPVCGLFGQSPPVIREMREALSSGDISLVAHGNGSRAGFSVDGYLRNNTSSDIRVNIFISNGLYLRNSGAGQNMLAIQIYREEGRYTMSGSAKYIQLPPKENTPIMLRAICADFERDSPSSEESFTMDSVPSDIQAIASRISRYMADHFDDDEDLDLPIQLALCRVQGKTRSDIEMAFDFSDSDWDIATEVMSY